MTRSVWLSTILLPVLIEASVFATCRHMGHMDILESHTARSWLKQHRTQLPPKCLILALFLLGLGLLIYLPREVRFSKELNVHYPTHLGIGCFIWGSMSLLYATAIFVLWLKLRKYPKTDETQNKALCHSPAAAQQKQDLEASQQPADPAADGLATPRDCVDGLQTAELVSFKRVKEYGEKLQYPRTMFWLEVARCTLNIGLQVSSFATISLAPREALVRLDQSRRAVAWVEGPMSCAGATRLWYELVVWALGYSGLGLVLTIRTFGGFSVLRSLPQANLRVAGTRISKELFTDRDYLQAAYHFCWWLFLGHSWLAC